MEEDKALAQFVAADERAARRAYDVLAARARAFLRAYLARTTGLAAEQREDVIQDTLLRFWGARAAYRDAGAGAWRGWLKATARRCCVDLYRRTPDAVAADGLAEAVADDAAGPLAALMDALESRALRHRADVLWLGLDPALAPEAHTRRLLAAQLLYLDRLPWDAVLRLLGPAPPGAPPLTRDTLDAWLADPGVLRHLAYHTLRYGNDRLAGFLLGLPDPPDSAALDGLARDPARLGALAASPGRPAWAPAEAAAILWRYRQALLFEQILQRDDCALTPDALRVLIDRTLACFPFSDEMASLLAALGPRGRTALADRGLWQRLAFAYRYGDGLPHQDIRDRTQPAYRHVAEPSRPDVTLGMLNVWLSNGRLLERLARACRAAGEIGESHV